MSTEHLNKICQMDCLLCCLKEYALQCKLLQSGWVVHVDRHQAMLM
jgi:hypothetical protein